MATRTDEKLTSSNFSFTYEMTPRLAVIPAFRVQSSQLQSAFPADNKQIFYSFVSVTMLPCSLLHVRHHMIPPTTSSHTVSLSSSAINILLTFTQSREPGMRALVTTGSVESWPVFSPRLTMNTL